MGKYDGKIMEILRAKKKVGMNELAKALGLKSSISIYPAILRMVAEEKVKVERIGRNIIITLIEND